jgi:lysozyme
MTRPFAKRDQAIAAAVAAWRAHGMTYPLPAVAVLAVRGFYLKSLGDPRKLACGLYEDAIFILGPDLTDFRGFNANTDPSRIGWHPNAEDHMARLQRGAWTFKRLRHQPGSPTGHMAFGQDRNRVTVEFLNQAGAIAKAKTGLFGINVHRGGDKTTASKGGITIPPSQWQEFYLTLAKLVKSDPFPLILANGPIC